VDPRKPRGAENVEDRQVVSQNGCELSRIFQVREEPKKPEPGNQLTERAIRAVRQLRDCDPVRIVLRSCCRTDRRNITALLLLRQVSNSVGQAFQPGWKAPSGWKAVTTLW